MKKYTNGVICKKSLHEVKEKIVEDKIRIRRLIGNNGYIREREYI